MDMQQVSTTTPASALAGEDVEMYSGDGSKSSGLAPKRVWQAETMTSWLNANKNDEADTGDQGVTEHLPGCMKEDYFRDEVTILKTVDLN